MIDWWYQKIDEHSPLYIALNEWAPVFFTVVIGGLFAVIIFPRWQDRYLNRKTIYDNRVKISEKASELLNSYTTIWRRLIEISHYEKKAHELGGDLASVRQRKEEYVRRRTEIHDDLMACLARAKIYVTEEQQRDISEFVRWAESLSTLTLEELPDIVEWREWEDRLSAKLRVF